MGGGGGKQMEREKGEGSGVEKGKKWREWGRGEWREDRERQGQKKTDRQTEYRHCQSGHLEEGLHSPGPAKGHDGLICMDVLQCLGCDVLHTENANIQQACQHYLMAPTEAAGIVISNISLLTLLLATSHCRHCY